VYYIQYAYVRTHSIIRKAKDEHNFVPAPTKQHFSEDEQLILKKIVELKHLLCHISKTHQTHLIAYYTYEIANLFHKYYNSTKVIQENDKQTSQERLAFIQLIQQVLGLCCNLMGISCPERM
jgi:arginyl-tRNA synthetase